MDGWIRIQHPSAVRFTCGTRLPGDVPCTQQPVPAAPPGPGTVVPKDLELSRLGWMVPGVQGITSI